MQAPAMPTEDDAVLPLWSQNDNDFLAQARMDLWSSSDIDMWNALVPDDGTDFMNIARLQGNSAGPH